MGFIGDVLSRIPAFSNELFEIAKAQGQLITEAVVDNTKLFSDELVTAIPVHLADNGRMLVDGFAKMVRSSDGFESLIRFGEDGIAFFELFERTDRVAKPILVAFGHIGSVIGAARIVHSFHYVASGKFLKDINEGNTLPLVSQAAFLLRRVVVTTHWLIDHNAITVEGLAQIAEKTGSTPLFNFLSQTPKGPYLGGTLIVALTPIAIGHLRNIIEGKDIVYNAFEFGNLALDISLVAARNIFGSSDPYVDGALTALSFISGGIGVLAFFYNPENQINVPDLHLEEPFKFLFSEAQKAYEAAAAGIQEGIDAISPAIAKGHEVVTHILGGASKCVRQVEGLRAISNTAQTAIRFMTMQGVPVDAYEKIIETLRSVNEVITVRNIILRTAEFVSGEAMWKHSQENFPNLVKIASRVAYVISDIFSTLKFLEKYEKISEGTGNALALNMFGAEMKVVVPVLSYIAVALDLADNISIAVKDGLDWDNGIAIGSSFGKFVSICLADSKDPMLMVCGFVAGGTAGLLFFIKFVRTEVRRITAATAA